MALCLRRARGRCCAGALGADWARRLPSERPADYVRLRAETKPAQPLNFTAFGSFSRSSSAHSQTRCSTEPRTDPRTEPGTEERAGPSRTSRTSRTEQDPQDTEPLSLTEAASSTFQEFLFLLVHVFFFSAAGVKELNCTCERARVSGSTPGHSEKKQTPDARFWIFFPPFSCFFPPFCCLLFELSCFLVLLLVSFPPSSPRAGPQQLPGGA